MLQSRRPFQFFAKTFMTLALYGTTLALNAWLFPISAFDRGLWIYLPAGARLVCVLLFQEGGALGLLIGSVFAGYFYFFPNDLARGLAGGIAATLAPYAVYRIASAAWHLRASLQSLTTKRLLVLAVADAVANAGLQHAWRMLAGADQLAMSPVARFVGDLTGILVFLYAARMGMQLFARLRKS